MIETNIRNTLLNDTTISGLVGTSIYFPYAPKEQEAPYINFFRISGNSEFYETNNDDLYQIDIFVDRSKYNDAMTLKNAIKILFVNAYVPDCVMEYISDTQDYQFDESLFRVILTYRVNNKI